jgi:hypothetical protein
MPRPEVYVETVQSLVGQKLATASMITSSRTITTVFMPSQRGRRSPGYVTEGAL